MRGASCHHEHAQAERDTKQSSKENAEKLCFHVCKSFLFWCSNILLFSSLEIQWPVLSITEAPLFCACSCCPEPWSLSSLVTTRGYTIKQMGVCVFVIIFSASFKATSR